MDFQWSQNHSIFGRYMYTFDTAPAPFAQTGDVLTLAGGFASTVSWPVTYLLMQATGWRGTYLVYAAVLALIAAPLHAFPGTAIPVCSPSSRTSVRGRPTSIRFWGRKLSGKPSRPWRLPPDSPPNRPRNQAVSTVNWARSCSAPAAPQKPLSTCNPRWN